MIWNITLIFVVLTLTQKANAQTAQDILGAKQETDSSTKLYKVQAEKIMYHYGIDTHNIPCAKIDSIDIYGNGDGFINPHSIVPAGSHNEWKKSRFKFAKAFDQIERDDQDPCKDVAPLDRVFVEGKCYSLDQLFGGSHESQHSAYSIPGLNKNSVYCSAYDVTDLVNEGRKRVGEGSVSDDKAGYFYPYDITYEDKGHHILSYARECRSDKIVSSQVTLAPAGGNSTTGIKCRSLAGKKEIAPQEIQSAFGKYLITDNISYWSKATNPFYDSSKFDLAGSQNQPPMQRNIPDNLLQRIK